MTGLVRTGRGGRTARARKARAVVAAALLFPWAVGCYRSVPVWNGAPQPGQTVTVGLTDRGRVALAPVVGPGVRTITGRLTQASDSAMTLAVTGVEYISSGVPTKWNGELVTVPRDVLSGVTERQYSRTRTWLAFGIAAVAAAAIATIAIEGFGNGSDQPKLPPDPQPQ